MNEVVKKVKEDEKGRSFEEFGYLVGNLGVVEDSTNETCSVSSEGKRTRL